MKPRTWIVAVALVAVALPLFPRSAQEQAPEGPTMEEVMEKWQRYCAPGEEHGKLELFLGEWNTELRFTQSYGAMTSEAVEKGTCTFRWLIEGLWVQSESKGTVLGMPVHSFMTIGYDRMKMSYVTSAVDSMNTYMLHSEGDFDPKGKVLITYGTLDEWITGEHDKMVKYVWRFVDADKIVFEVHDLPIGEENTKVVEITYTRKT